MIERFSNWITRRARFALTLVFLLTLISLARLIDPVALVEQRFSEVLQLEIDPSISSILTHDDPERDYNDRIRAIFGNEETLLLAVRPPDGVFQTEALAAVKRTTAALAKVGGVRSVLSLANAPDVRSEDRDLIVEPLYDDPPTDPEALAHLAQRLAQNPILSRSLVSADGTTTAIVGSLLEMSEVEQVARGIDRSFLEIARREFGPDAQVWLSGAPHLKAETQRALLRDMTIVVPLIALLLTAIAYLSFRSVRGVLVPLASLGIGILWALAVASVIFSKLNIVTTTAPAILLAIGFAYSVHIVSAYYEALSEQAEGRSASAAAEAVRRVGLATLLTCLTTAVGFVSLAVSPIPAIQEFGLLCGVGILCLLITTLGFAPAMLQVLPERIPERRSRSDWIERAMVRFGEFSVERPNWILGAGALVAIVSLASLPLVRVGTDVLHNFSEDTPIRQSVSAINASFGGADRLYVVVEAEERGAFKDPENLQQLVELQGWLEAQPEVGNTTSVTDYVKLLNRGFHEDDPAYFAIPESQQMVSQLLFFGANDAIKKLVNSQYQIANIPVLVNIFDTNDIARFAGRVTDRLEQLPARLQGRVTGLSVLVARANEDLVTGQALSLFTAFVTIYAILAILFLSLRVGLLAMIPNLLPVLIYFGALGWSGVTLNVVTGLVACLVLGIAVDDTIHFLARFNVLAREKGSSQEGVRLALPEVGRAVTYTSAALCAGFLGLTASTLQQQVEFGALAAFTIAVAWAVDVTFTPALASRLRVVTLWDLLSLDLGKDPGHTIGLFSGLRAGQARIVALMGTLVNAPAGRALFHTGEPADGLFVVIGGRVRTWVDSPEDTLTVEDHTAGDTVGEVGLFHGTHVLHGAVEEDARLLRLTQGSFRELGRRYPRIASVVLRNTNELLAGRLAFHTQGHQLGDAFESRAGQPADALLHGGLEDTELGDSTLRASLVALGIEPRTLRALALIPMIQVAWADGHLDDRERHAILEAASALGIEPGSDSYVLLGEWLAAPPMPELFASWRDYVATLIHRLSVEGRLRLRASVLERARGVAAAAGGVAGLRTVSRHEERVILELTASFDEIDV